MLVDESLIDNTRLLLAQRLQLVDSRYVGLQQIRQHDLKLITNIKLLLKRENSSELPAWFNWLDQDNVTPLDLADLDEFINNDRAWLLLTEIKVLLQPTWLDEFIKAFQHNPEAEYSRLFWQLAARLQLKLNPFCFSQPLTGQALWYIVCSAQPQLQPELQQLLIRLLPTDPLMVYTKMALHSYNNGFNETASNNKQSERFCELALISQLIKTEQLKPEHLMLLLISAPESKQTEIINYLINNIATQSLAILALAISGKAKFIALLLELAQQADTSEEATDSLGCILGVIEADSLLCDVNLLANLHLNANSKYLAGHTLNSTVLALVWQQGNQLQRRIAACYARLADNNTYWREPDTLLGGAWHCQ
ncbi:hypothetical protein [Rheinheimera sp. MMS21-TC3]|uniref:hypothetical protein n=1 Tax=Rheinheimera sp. MMS21-TC3 TaxID=3072790 RepID=UPI0028C3A2D2|nr:hypothetical protein [Rheinheimera sp. MMS21-TC3]WNO61005.1 hypothetical protein RDV63_08590 [Rheinheimera sp. MMS21-TC3]